MRRVLPSLILGGLLLLCGHALAQSAGVTLSTTSLTVPEGGAATYTVVLSTAPSYAVTITMGKQSGGDADLTVSPASLSFSTSNWNTARTVTVTAKQDSDTADGTATITHTATSSDSNYSGITINSLTATEDDDDTAGVTLSATSLSVPEGGSATYTMRLATLPTATVYVDLAKQSGGDANLTFSPPQLTFTTKGWDLPQRVTVSAAQDADAADGTATITHTATSTDSSYSGITIASVSATEDDDDLGVTLSKTSLSVPEGSSATYTVVLDGAPAANVTIAVAKQTSGDDNLTVSPASLTFSTTNWNTAQTVTVSAAQDGDEANGTATLTHSVTSTGTDFTSSLTIASVTATEDDDDTPGVTVSTTSLTVPEGGAATYTIVLDTQPTGNVEITATPHSQSDTSLTTSGSLTFGTTNWNTAQTVTVSAAQDNDNVNGTALINHTALSADTDYGGITIASVTATEADDDAGVTLSRTSVSVTEGSTATYTVVLDTAPSANVTIAVANRGQSSDDSDLTVSPASLTFTSSNWNTTGTVTVSAAQDADTADGSAVITHTATSTDSNYGGITISSVTATEDDDDTAPTSANATLAVSRDNRTAIPLSNLPFSDGDGGTLRGVKIVTPPGASAGTLGLVKTGIYAGAATVLCVGTIDAIVAGQEVLNAVSSVLYFCPKDGFTHTTFRFQVIDSQGRSSAQTYTATLVGPPGQVTGLAAEAGSGYVRLSWTDPQNPAITGYEVRQKSGANAYGAWTAMTGTNATTTRYSVGSLTNATAYTFQVRAKSKGGAGPIPSAAVTATPASATKPAKPTGFRGLLGLYNCTVSGTDYYCVHLFWDDPLDPTITRWEVERKHPSDPNNWIKGSIAWPDKKVPNSSASTTSVIVAAGGGHITTAYKFRVRAVNTAGAGPWSAEESVFVNPHDAAPVLLAPTAGNGRVALNWRYFGPQAACSSACWDVNQAPISNAGKDLRTHTVTGLTNGQTYTYKVRTSVVNADNSIVDGPESNQVSITLPAAPAKPTVTVKPASAGASLSWTDPDNDDITGWQYRQKAGGSYGSWTRVPGSDGGTTSFSVSGLTNGTAYTFQVRAVIEYTTALGGPLAGAASDEASVTPVGVVVSKDRLALTEGAAVSTYTVALSHAPTADVTITVAVDSDGTVTADTNDNLTGNQTTLTFTSADYSAKTVKVTAAEDDDGRHSTATITHTVTSTDARYGNLTGIPGLTAAVTDNDSLGITLSGSSVSVAEGSTATYTVRLGAKPTSDVTVTIARNSGGDTDLTVDADPASGNQNKKTLTFTTANYNTAQTVTVSAAQDNNDVIDSTATFTHTAAGGGYGNVTAVTLTATEADNDTGIVLTPASVSVPEGSTATYTVKLGTQPSGNVTVTIARNSTGDTDLTVDTDPAPGNQNKKTLTFTGGNTGNWNTAQTVTVTAQDDSDALNGTATFTHTAAGAGSGYAGATATLTATEADNERGIVLTPSSGVSVPEGGTATYTVKLASQPSANVTVTIARNTGGDNDLTVDTDPASGNQNKKTLTFTNGNWNTAQTVTVSAAEDDSDVINGTATFTHTATNGGYGGVSATLTATETDDEAGITLSETSVSVPEGGTATYTVELAFQPSADVTVTIARNSGGDSDLTVDTDPASGNQNKKTLTFTNGNWNDKQTVTVWAAVDGDDDNGTATFTHTPSGGGYGGAAATLTATESDGARGITLVPASGVTVPEGGTATYTVVLDSQPSANVTVEITKTGDTHLSVTSPAPDNQNKTKLTFTGGNNGNWASAQTVTVSAAEDGDDDNGTATFTHTPSGGGYDDVTAVSLTATEADNERGIVLSPASVSLPEGTTWDYTVRLASQPDSDVTVAIARNTGGDGDLTVNKSSLTFTSSNWNKDQTVTVTAKEDNDALNGTATFTHTASDGSYAGVTANLPVTEEDNERGLELSASSLAVPEGAGAQYTARLKSQPTGNVTVTIIRIAEANTDEDLTLDTNPKTTGDQNTLTFTTSNWNSTQTVTVSAAADDGDASNGTARFGHAATGGGYGGVSALLTATEVDDEPGTTLSKTGVSVPEGGTATYTVKLAFRPSVNVTVTVTKNADGDTNLTADKSSLTFKVVNWNQTQTVTVTATADKDALNGTATFTHTAAGGGYGGTSTTLTATEADSERGITLSTASVSVPENGTKAYTVKLNSRPTGNVTVTIARNSDGDTDLTVDNNSLTFTTSNWNSTQRVTVSAKEDDGDTANGTATFTHTAAGGGYDGVSATLTATEADNDRSIVLSPASVSVAEGSTVTYTVKLNSQPTGNVMVTIAKASGGDAHLSVNKNSLTFTTSTWNQTQAVTVSAAEENSDDYTNGTATFTHAAAGGGYDNVSASLTATESDNDRVVGIPAVLSVPEGETSTYDVKLAEQPSSNVTLTVTATQSSNAAVTVDTDANAEGNQNKMTFTPANYSTAQTVTVAAAQDEDTVNGSAVITTTASSSDASYHGVPIPGVVVSEVDTASQLRGGDGGGGGGGSTPAVVGAALSKLNVPVPEGSTVTYTVKLASQPAAAVTLTVANRGSDADDPDLTVDTDPATLGNQNTLTFTPATWDTLQTVTLAAAHDADGLDGTAVITHTLPGATRAARPITIAAVTATELDDDRAVTLSAPRVSVPEGGTASYTVALATQPTSVVTISVANRGGAADDADLTASPTTLTFTPGDWNTPQTVTLAAAQDADGVDGVAVITHAATSGDAGYDAIAIANVTVTELDDDRAVTLSASNVSVPEGGTASYTVVLATPPTAAVRIAVANRGGPADDADLRASPATLTFTPDTWSTPQTVTLSAARDADALDGSALITHTATSDDTGYDAIAIADVTATEVDDDADAEATEVDADPPGVDVSASNVSVSEGGTASYTVVLARQPTADVIVTVGNRGDAADDADLTASPTTLTFTPATWNAPQTITIAAAQDDDGVDGSAVITHTAASSDAGYDAIAIPDVTATEVDDDPLGVEVSAASITVAEGDTASYTVALVTQPSADVTVTVGNRGDDTDLTASPTALTFTPATWSTPQTITVAAAQDDDGVDGSAVITHTATSSDTGYDAIVIAEVTATEVDDDPIGVEVSAASVSVSEGGTASYTVALATQPTADVTLAVGNRGADTDDPDLTAGPTTLTFTPATWNTPQMVTVTAAHDDDSLNGSAVITHAAVSDDAGYDAIAIAEVTATETDDDLAPLFVGMDEDDSLALVPDQRYVQSVPIDPLALPEATGGLGDLTYTLTPPAPPGLTFDAAARTLTGIPTRLQPPTAYTYQATAANGLSAALTFAIEVADLAPTAVGGLPDVRLTPGGKVLPVEVAGAFSGTNLMFAAASSDTTVATVSVVEATVSVAPVAAGEATVTVTARNSAGTAEQSFVVTVAADLAEEQAVEDTLAAVGRGMLTSLETTLGARLNGQLSHGVRLGGYSLLGDGEAWRGNTDRLWLDEAPFGEMPAANQMPDWLGGTSFALAMNDAADGTGGRWTLWGQGDVQTFSTRENTVIDGEMRTMYLGLDRRMADGWLLGGALSYSASTADYSFSGTDTSGSGRLETTLVNLYPYAHKPLSQGSLWAVLGLGVGNGSIEPWRSGPGLVETGDLSMLAALAGGRHELLATASGIRASLLGSLASLRLKTASAEGLLSNLTAAVHQMRVGLESSYEAHVAAGTLEPFAQVSLRHDDGDGVTGSGLEVSGGVRYHAGRLSMELGARMLAAHVSSGYEESGWHAAVRLEPRAGGEGLSLSVTPTWGLADHRPVDALWSGEVFTALDGAPSAVGGMQTQVGYGLRLPSWSALLTPYVEHASAASGDLRTRVGMRLEHDSRFRLDVRGERLESAGASAADRGIFLEVGMGL